MSNLARVCAVCTGPNNRNEAQDGREIFFPYGYLSDSSIVSLQDHRNVELEHDEGSRSTSPSPPALPETIYPASQSTRSSPPFPLCMLTLDHQSCCKEADSELRGGLDFRVIVFILGKNKRD